MKRIDREELEAGTGADGRPALVAIRGKVYDVSGSALWAGGKHMSSHAAGADLSLAIQAAPHGDEVLARVREVGTTEVPAGAAPTVMPRPTGLAAAILARHPHPVTVHFPIALLATAALFLVAALLLDRAWLEVATLCNLGVGLCAAPVAAAAGLLSWRFNYGGTWTSIFRRKVALSGMLLGVAGAALVIRVGVLGLHAVRAGGWWWAYVALVLADVPLVLGLGYLGGKITFPR
jgi:predicted heme/steroid binding protein/uncharacterized membrane protein